MKKKHLLVCLAVAIGMVSCNNELQENNSFISIEATIAPQSRTPQLGTDGSGSFSEGDHMSLFVSNSDNANVMLDYEYGSEYYFVSDNMQLPSRLECSLQNLYCSK